MAEDLKREASKESVDDQRPEVADTNDRAVSVPIAFKVNFDGIEWQGGRPGVRHKTYSDGIRQIRLVEFATSEGDPTWCIRGHIGFVLAGSLDIEFHGQMVSFVEGDGLFIPAGAAHEHRGRSIAPGTQLLMVEDV